MPVGRQPALHCLREDLAVMKLHARKRLLALDVGAAAEAKVKAYKIKCPRGVTRKEVLNWVDTQSVIVVEDFKLDGRTLYLYPYMEQAPQLKTQQRLQQDFDAEFGTDPD